MFSMHPQIGSPWGNVLNDFVRYFVVVRVCNDVDNFNVFKFELSFDVVTALHQNKLLIVGHLNIHGHGSHVFHFLLNPGCKLHGKFGRFLVWEGGHDPGFENSHEIGGETVGVKCLHPFKSGDFPFWVGIGEEDGSLGGALLGFLSLCAECFDGVAKERSFASEGFVLLVRNWPGCFDGKSLVSNELPHIFRPMGADGADEDDNGVNPLVQGLFVHFEGAIFAPRPVLVSGSEHFEPSALEAFAKLHFGEALGGEVHQAIDFVDEDLIHEVGFGGSK